MNAAASARIARAAGTVALLAAVSAVVAWHPNTDSDTWYHLSVGRWVATHHEVPTTDAWTHTEPGNPWISHSWLYGLVLYTAWSLAGAAGMAALRTVMMTATLFLLDRTAARNGVRAVLRLPLMAIAAAAAGTRVLDRPQMATFLLAAATLWLLDRWVHRRGGRAPDADAPWGTRADLRDLWPLAPLFWVWACCHSGVVYGIGLVGAFFLDALWRRDTGSARALLVAGCAAVAASLATPNHVLVHGYALVVLPSLRAAGLLMPEFLSRMPGESAWPRLAVGLVMLLWLAVARRRPLRESLIVLGVGLYALRWWRERATFALLAAPCVAAGAAVAWDALRARMSAPRLVAGLGVVALFIGAWASLRPERVLNRASVWRIEEPMPAGLVDFHLANALPATLYNTIAWGGYIVWRAEGHVRVFIDPRMELYSRETLRENMLVQSGLPGTTETLRRRGVECAMIPFSDGIDAALEGAPPGRIATVLWNDPEWLLVRWDDHGMIYLGAEAWRARHADLPVWSAFNPDERDAASATADADALTSRITALRAHAAAQPTVRRSREMLGMMLEKAGSFAEARGVWDGLSRRADARPSDFDHLAFACDSMGDLPAALGAARAGIAKFPDSAVLHDTAGIAAATLGDVEAGYGLLLRAERLGGATHARAVNLARMAARLGRTDEARRHAEEAARLAPATP